MTDTQRFSDLPVASVVGNGDFVLGLAGGAPARVPVGLLGGNGGSGSGGSTGSGEAANPMLPVGNWDMTAVTGPAMLGAGVSEYPLTAPIIEAGSNEISITMDSPALQYANGRLGTVGGTMPQWIAVLPDINGINNPSFNSYFLAFSPDIGAAISSAGPMLGLSFNNGLSYTVGAVSGVLDPAYLNGSPFLAVIDPVSLAISVLTVNGSFVCPVAAPVGSIVWAVVGMYVTDTATHRLALTLSTTTGNTGGLTPPSGSEPFQGIIPASKPAGAVDGSRWLVTAPGPFVQSDGSLLQTMAGSVVEFRNSLADLIVSYQLENIQALVGVESTRATAAETILRTAIPSVANTTGFDPTQISGFTQSSGNTLTAGSGLGVAWAYARPVNQAPMQFETTVLANGPAFFQFGFMHNGMVGTDPANGLGVLIECTNSLSWSLIVYDEFGSTSYPLSLTGMVWKTAYGAVYDPATRQFSFYVGGTAITLPVNTLSGNYGVKPVVRLSNAPLVQLSCNFGATPFAWPQAGFGAPQAAHGVRQPARFVSRTGGNPFTLIAGVDYVVYYETNNTLAPFPSPASDGQLITVINNNAVDMPQSATNSTIDGNSSATIPSGSKARFLFDAASAQWHSC